MHFLHIFFLKILSVKIGTHFGKKCEQKHGSSSVNNKDLGSFKEELDLPNMYD